MDFNGFQCLDNLGELHLEYNKLTNIESNTLEYLNKLKILDLCGNQIEQIDTNGFRGLDNLEEFNLSDNKLTKIESNLFQHLNIFVLFDYVSSLVFLDCLNEEMNFIRFWSIYSSLRH